MLCFKDRVLPTGFVESRQYPEAQESSNKLLLTNNNNNLFKLNVSLGLNGNTERTFDVLGPGRSYCNQGLNADIL